MKKLILLLLCLSLVLALAGCSQPEAPDEAQQPSVEAPTESEAPEQPADAEPVQPEAAYPIELFRIGTTASIETAVFGEYNYDMLASGLSELPLVWQDAEGNYHPLLVSYETEDAVTWSYTVEPGMCWSDGEPVTAADILFTLEYDDANGSANFVSQTDADGKVTEAKYAAYVLSDDGLSISLTLASANVRELSNMTSFRVMPKHIYEGKEAVTEAEARVTCGPYMLESFHKEAGTLTFVPNPYYPKTPNAGKVVCQLFGNEDTMYLALQSGDLDMVWAYSAGVSGAYQDVLAADENLTLESVASANAPAVLAFNNANGPFSDENLRLAVSYALDYDSFRTVFGSAYASDPNRGFVPPVTAGYKETEPLHQDLEKAKQYMIAAGYTDTNIGGFYLDADGAPCVLRLTCNAAKEAHVGYAELVKTQLEDFGIVVELETLDADSYNAKTSNKFSGNNITMEAAIYGYTAAGMGMKNGLATIYVDGTHPVQGGCQVFDEGFQAILAEMSAAKTLDEYSAAASKMQDWYAAHMPFIALYWDSQLLAHSAAYENFTVDAVFGLNNANTWFSITAK